MLHSKPFINFIREHSKLLSSFLFCFLFHTSYFVVNVNLQKVTVFPVGETNGIFTWNKKVGHSILPLEICSESLFTFVICIKMYNKWSVARPVTHFCYISEGGEGMREMPGKKPFVEIFRSRTLSTFNVHVT